jgi:hypothetical protein
VTTTVFVDIDNVAGGQAPAVGETFAYPDNITLGVSATSPQAMGGLPAISLTATDSASANFNWVIRFSHQGIPGIPSDLTTPAPAGPLSFAVSSGSLSTIVWSPDSVFNVAFPAGLPVGTVVALTGASLPSGFTTATPYYVVNTSTTGFGLSAAYGGSAIIAGAPGAGTFSVTRYRYSGLYTAVQARKFAAQALAAYRLPASKN